MSIAKHAPYYARVAQRRGTNLRNLSVGVQVSPRVHMKWNFLSEEELLLAQYYKDSDGFNDYTHFEVRDLLTVIDGL